MPRTTLANLLWIASDLIDGVLDDCSDMYFGELSGEPLSNVIWLVDGLLEDAIKELGKMSTRSDEQAA